jgi:hypothetical protein
MHASITFPSGITMNTKLCEFYSNLNFSKYQTHNCVENYDCISLLAFSIFSSICFSLLFMVSLRTLIFCNSKNQSYFINLALLIQNSAFEM